MHAQTIMKQLKHQSGIENSTGVSLSAICFKKYIMAVKVNMIEQSQGVKFDSSALNGLRGLAAFHVMVFHSILYSNFSFSINGTVRSFIHIVQIF